MEASAGSPSLNCEFLHLFLTADFWVFLTVRACMIKILFLFFFFFCFCWTLLSSYVGHPMHACQRAAMSPVSFSRLSYIKLFE